MDAYFLSVCLQLVKKPPGATQCARTRQFVYEITNAISRATIETDSEKNIEHNKNMYSTTRRTQ